MMTAVAAAVMEAAAGHGLCCRRGKRWVHHAAR